MGDDGQRDFKLGRATLQIPDFGAMYRDMGNSHPDLKRGLCECSVCHRRETVNSAACLATGRPKCCGYTMTLMPAGTR